MFGSVACSTLILFCMQNSTRKAAAKGLHIREKLERFGPAGLSGQELLAILYGQRRNEAANLELASSVIANYGNRSIADEKDIARMQSYSELPREACMRTIAAFELGRRYACKQHGRPRKIHTPVDAYRLLRGRMEDQRKECLYAIYLDGQNRILREAIISIGTINQTFMQPRDIFEPAFECNATSIVIAHNHPDGDPEPSMADIANTKKLQEAASMMRFEILDHIVIGSDSYRSILQ